MRSASAVSTISSMASIKKDERGRPTTSSGALGVGFEFFPVRGGGSDKGGLTGGGGLSDNLEDELGGSSVSVLPLVVGGAGRGMLEDLGVLERLERSDEGEATSWNERGEPSSVTMAGRGGEGSDGFD